jgi:hypothetical protein
MFLGRKARLVRRADKLTAIYEPIVLDNVGSLTPQNPIGLQGLLRDSFTLLYLEYHIKLLHEQKYFKT